MDARNDEGTLRVEARGTVDPSDSPREPFRDQSLPVSERVSDLLGRLSVTEKAGQLTQFFYMGIAANIPADFDITTIPEEYRAHLDQPKMVNTAIAEGRAGSVLFIFDPAGANFLQRIALEEGSHGIPLLLGFDVIHGMRTIFPVPIALAATWNPDTAEQAQRIAARESRAIGIHWSFGPMVDITRDARWGRIIEGAGEDPTLASAMAAAQVRGFQGDLGPDSILAGPKHFLGYGASRGGRDYEDAEISDVELYNLYLPPFRAAIQAGARNVMSAYMDLNGVPATGNEWLLTRLLRDELGFEGFVVSDANSVSNMVIQHFAEDLPDAAARALTAGLDMEMTMFNSAYATLPDAVEAGRVSEADLDKAVARILTVKFELGLFENPYVDEQRAVEILDDPASRLLAAEAAEQSVVLLKNDGLLPLDASSRPTLAVIGHLGDSKRDTIGPWVFNHRTDEAVTIREGIAARVGESTQVRYEAGVWAPDRLRASPFDGTDPAITGVPDGWDDDAALEQAVRVAEAADVAIVVVGEPQNHIGEAASRSVLDLPGRQLEQLQAIARTGTPVVLLVMSGRPLDLRWAQEHVPAIAEVWYPGVRGGDAVAAILFGDTSPAGRLPFTWPRHVGQVPATYLANTTFHPEEIDIRYFDETSAPLYPFGHGLSYASFEYSDLQVSDDRVPIGETVTVSVDVTNTSEREADEVTQLYTHQRFGTASRPVRELKGFSRQTYGPGETRTLTFRVGPEELQYWSGARRDWVQDATDIEVWVGGSCTADLHAGFTVTR